MAFFLHGLGWLGSVMGRGVVALGCWAGYRPVGLSGRSLSAVWVGVLLPRLSPLWGGGGRLDAACRVLRGVTLLGAYGRGGFGQAGGGVG